MGWMSAICDAHKKKVGVELLYNSVHRNSISWRQDAVEKASTQQRESSGLRLRSCSWGSDELEIRCDRENQHPERLAPRPPVEQHRRTGKKRWWPQEWGSICCSSVRSPTPPHTQPFQIKWEVYFSKNCVARLYCVVVMHLHAESYVLCVCMVMTIQHFPTIYSLGEVNKFCLSQRDWLRVISKTILSEIWTLVTYAIS